MFTKRRRRNCSVQKGLKIICPHCGGVLQVPMCQAVNGEKITCQYCNQEFIFGA